MPTGAALPHGPARRGDLPRLSLVWLALLLLPALAVGCRAPGAALPAADYRDITSDAELLELWLARELQRPSAHERERSSKPDFDGRKAWHDAALAATVGKEPESLGKVVQSSEALIERLADFDSAREEIRLMMWEVDGRLGRGQEAYAVAYMALVDELATWASAEDGYIEIAIRSWNTKGSEVSNLDVQYVRSFWRKIGKRGMWRALGSPTPCTRKLSPGDYTLRTVSMAGDAHGQEEVTAVAGPVQVDLLAPRS